MNKLRHQAKELAYELAQIERPNTWIGICPPALWLSDLKEILENSQIELGGQDCVGDIGGSNTGSLSAAMFYSVGCTFCIVGHSERRSKNVTDKDVAESALSLQSKRLLPVVCVGETLQQRISGDAENAVRAQLDALLISKVSLEKENLVVAYEPVWAIGTGKVCDDESIASMHTFIRNYLHVPDLRVLYGGSVHPESARGIFGLEEVSGALVGGASLNFVSFKLIVDEWGEG